MKDEQENTRVYFLLEGCDGNEITKRVKLPWDTPWTRIIYEVAKALEGYGYIDVVNRIKVRNLEHEFDKEVPKYIKLREEIDNLL